MTVRRVTRQFCRLEKSIASLWMQSKRRKWGQNDRQCSLWSGGARDGLSGLNPKGDLPALHCQQIRADEGEQYQHRNSRKPGRYRWGRTKKRGSNEIEKVRYGV